MKTKLTLLLSFLLATALSSMAQLGPITKPFTHADTLRGTITPERAWWDVLHYTILVVPDFDSQQITGKSDIQFRVVAPGKRMQIDLQQPMELTKAYFRDKKVPFTREGDVYWLDMPACLKEP
jgi:hypothetical protein